MVIVFLQGIMGAAVHEAHFRILGGGTPREKLLDWEGSLLLLVVELFYFFLGIFCIVLQKCCKYCERKQAQRVHLLPASAAWRDVESAHGSCTAVMPEKMVAKRVVWRPAQASPPVLPGLLKCFAYILKDMGCGQCHGTATCSHPTLGLARDFSIPETTSPGCEPYARPEICHLPTLDCRLQGPLDGPAWIRCLLLSSPPLDSVSRSSLVPLPHHWVSPTPVTGPAQEPVPAQDLASRHGAGQM